MKIVLTIDLKHRNKAIQALESWGVPFNELGYPDGRVEVLEVYESEINKTI